MKDALTRQEWVIMEALWQKHPMFLSEIMQSMRTAVDWKKSTYSTYLKKLCETGYLGYETISGNRCYYPLVEREACIQNESRQVMSKFTAESAKLFLTCMIQQSGLSGEEYQQLQALIEDLGGKTPEQGV